METLFVIRFSNRTLQIVIALAKFRILRTRSVTTEMTNGAILAWRKHFDFLFLFEF